MSSNDAFLRLSRTLAKATAPAKEASARAYVRNGSWLHMTTEQLREIQREQSEAVDEHADIDRLPVPVERRPPVDAPLRALAGYLVGTWWRRLRSRR